MAPHAQSSRIPLSQLPAPSGSLRDAAGRLPPRGAAHPTPLYGRLFAQAGLRVRSPLSSLLAHVLVLPRAVLLCAAGGCGSGLSRGWGAALTPWASSELLLLPLLPGDGDGRSCKGRLCSAHRHGRREALGRLVPTQQPLLDRRQARDTVRGLWGASPNLPPPRACPGPVVVAAGSPPPAHPRPFPSPPAIWSPKEAPIPFSS